MVKTQESTIDQAVTTTHRWLDQVQTLAELRNEAEAMSALRAVLHALRDRLTVDEATDLAAQLPTLVRGIYYEGWRPSQTPTKKRTLSAFLEHIKSELRTEIQSQPESCAKAVFAVLDEHLDEGVLDHARQMLPKELRTLWPRS